MLITQHFDLTDGSSCTLHFDESDGWLRAVWVGYIDPVEAHQGAQRFLLDQHTLHCPYLLNDNRAIQGPWFSSMDWLARVWVPQAAQLGLRYVAHLPQPGDLDLEATTVHNTALPEGFDIQVFTELAEAEQWLREMGAGRAD